MTIKTQLQLALVPFRAVADKAGLVLEAAQETAANTPVYLPQEQVRANLALTAACQAFHKALRDIIEVENQFAALEIAYANLQHAEKVAYECDIGEVASAQREVRNALRQARNVAEEAFDVACAARDNILEGNCNGKRHF